jgi:hypothetical protein
VKKLIAVLLFSTLAGAAFAKPAALIKMVAPSTAKAEKPVKEKKATHKKHRKARVEKERAPRVAKKKPSSHNVRFVK